MNIHLPAILMFTRGTRFWHTAICSPSRSAFSSYGDFAGFAEVSSFNSVDKRTAPVPDEQLQEASVKVVKPWGPWVPNYN